MFLNDKANGIGIYMKSDGTVYRGEWVDDRYHGQGKLILNTGEIYEGRFENGLKNGIGILEHIDGSIYEGDWKDGKIQGMGTYRWKNGKSYTG